MITTKSKVIKGGPVHITLMNMIREDHRIIAYSVIDTYEAGNWFTVYEFTFKGEEVLVTPKD